MSATSIRRGMTIVELVLALALFSFLAVVLLSLLDTSMGLWSRTETRRDVVETGSGVAELFAADVEALDPGPRGDLLVEWVPMDADRDGTNGAVYPRVRMVRRAIDAELLRIQADREADVVVQGEGLLEVCWMLLPSGPVTGGGGAPAAPVLVRGERVLGDESILSFFDDGFFGEDGRPVPGVMNEVTGGVLWFGVGLAAQTSVVHDGWSYGSSLADCARSWDAWRRRRPVADDHAWNEPFAGMPRVEGEPILPRRVRIEVELERPVDVKRRARLDDDLDAQSPVLIVDDPSRLPKVGAHVLVGEEWMKITGVTGSRVSVLRAQRGSRPLLHAAGDTLHFGRTVVREVPVALYHEDWGLGGSR